ncbi:MAG: Xaa-Pro dipeptidase [Gammaproteobacteria bacterium]|nr:Xaa-Pro dipeptidase [Gammaproteobacteria bacterium]|tara:strand:- start:459 stop:1808 length:1350 start_codon:yes stop_codon:yes gene_type:complete
MSKQNESLAEHLGILKDRWDQALCNHDYQLAVVAAGVSRTYLFDDQSPVFRANPHLAQWLGSDACEGSALILETGREPRLLFYSPADYWHQPPDPPEELLGVLNIDVFDSIDAIQREVNVCTQHAGQVAYVGDPSSAQESLGEVNPPALINELHYLRAYKTEYELQCMRQASARAVSGHLAAASAFAGGASEFELQLAYLDASRQTEADLPYPNIIALNQHAGILHYQHYERAAPNPRHSFLIDAGARHRNYAADVTRTYGSDQAGAAQQTFNALVAAMDRQQQELVSKIRPGLSFLDLHEDMHHRLGAMLNAAGLIQCDGEQAFDAGITRAFLPHGLGHLLGLQTHDVGGHQVDPEGTTSEPPESYQALRLTREIEVDQVFTIEPGLYFIPQLLEELRASEAGQHVCWPEVEALQDFGGIRIEDNVAIRADGVENLTRDAFAQAPGAA